VTAIEPVTVYSVCYGNYDRFLPDWWASVVALNPAPADVVLITDRPQPIDCRQVIAAPSGRYPYSTYLNTAVQACTTEHVATLDCDDTAMPDALAGTNYDVDVYIWGLERSDGKIHCPTNRSAGEVLELGYNPFNHGGVHTVDIWRRAGGFRDVGYSDWAFYIDCAHAGATFATSGRVNYRYQWHPDESMTGPLITDHDRHAAEALDPTCGRLM
jgi:hypothetical protein